MRVRNLAKTPLNAGKERFLPLAVGIVGKPVHDEIYPVLIQEFGRDNKRAVHNDSGNATNGPNNLGTMLLSDDGDALVARSIFVGHNSDIEFWLAGLAGYAECSAQRLQVPYMKKIKYTIDVNAHALYLKEKSHFSVLASNA